MLRNNRFFILLFASCFFVSYTEAQKTIQVLDGDSTFTIRFVLKSNDICLSSDNKGRLELSNHDLKKYKDYVFNLEFIDEMNVFIYKNVLFSKKENDPAENCLAFKQFRICDLFTKRFSSFFLRNKSNFVNDLEGL